MRAACAHGGMLEGTSGGKGFGGDKKVEEGEEGEEKRKVRQAGKGDGVMRITTGMAALASALAWLPAGAAQPTGFEPVDAPLVAFAVEVDEVVYMDEPFDIRVELSNWSDEPTDIVVHYGKSLQPFTVSMTTKENGPYLNLNLDADRISASAGRYRIGREGPVTPPRRRHVIKAQGAIEFTRRIDLRNHPTARPGTYRVDVSIHFGPDGDRSPAADRIADASPPSSGEGWFKKEIPLEVRTARPPAPSELAEPDGSGPAPPE